MLQVQGYSVIISLSSNSIILSINNLNNTSTSIVNNLNSWSTSSMLSIKNVNNTSASILNDLIVYLPNQQRQLII